MEKIAIYPGSFDPVTNGHLDMIERGLKLFDKIIVSILVNIEKDSLFSVEERTEMLKISLKKFSNVEVDTFDGLLVDYAAKRKVHAILERQTLDCRVPLLWDYGVGANWAEAK